MKVKPFYKNRRDAASKLIRLLNKYRGTDSIILSIPNGGIPIGKILSEELNLPIYFAQIKKIKHPDSNEINIGALSINHIVIDQDMEIEKGKVSKQIEKLRNKLIEELSSNNILNNQPSLQQKTIILTDDGITTGSTMLATLQLLQKENPAKKVLAVPVATYRSLRKLHNYLDEIVCLHMPETVDNIAGYYENFDNLSDKDFTTVIKQT